MKPVEVRQHDDGTWYARPYLGRNAVTGKAIRPYRRFPEAESEEEALAMAREWVAGLSGAAAMGSSLRMSDLLARYVEQNEPQWAENTARAYRNCLHWLDPVVGDIDADELKPHLVEAAYNVLLMRGGLNGRALSQASVRQVHDFLCGAFRWIVKAEIAPFNPMPSVQKPRLDRAEAAAFDEESFAKLLVALLSAMGDDAHTASNFTRRTCALGAWMALNTGLRCGEVCALGPSDLNLAARSLHVGATVVEPEGAPPKRQPRTKGGRSRNVSLGSDACWRLRRELEWREWLFKKGSDVPLVCGFKGELMRPSALSRWFSAFRDEAELPPGTTFHTLRHTHATMLIASGADMRTVQERLGHANVSTTLSLYAHVVPGRDQAAADAFEAASRRIGCE